MDKPLNPLNREASKPGRAEPPSRTEPPAGASGEPGISWAAMLAWIALAFALAGGVAFFLVRPFFHHF